MRLNKLIHGLTALICLVALAPKASALGVDMDFLYLSDALTGSNQASNSRMIWDMAATLNLNKKGTMVLGWNYGSFSATDKVGSTTNTLTISEMGPVFGYYIDKNFIYSVYLTYNMISTGKFNNGSSQAEWRGATLKAEFGFNPPISETVTLGLKLVYYQASFSEQIVGSTALSKTANGRTMIYPTVGIGIRFN